MAGVINTWGPDGVVVRQHIEATPELLRERLDVMHSRRFLPRRADDLINMVIDAFRLEGTGYDPTWLERRRAERAAKEAR